MRIAVLGSGSRGNCTYIEGDSGAILVDAGFSAAETLRRLSCAGGKAGLVKGMLLTHEHTDHVAGLSALARKLDVPVCATEGTLACAPARPGCRARMIPLRTSEVSHFSGFSIEPIATSHDALEPCGYRICEDGVSLACCTDTGVVSTRIVERLKACDAVMLESNHCPEMLRTGPYPEMLKRRIRSRKGHLSNTAAGDVLRELRSEVPVVILAHLSEVNNTPSKAIASAREALGFFAGDVEIYIASQHEPGPIIRL